MPGSSALGKRTPANRPDDARYISATKMRASNLLTRLVPATTVPIPATTVTADTPTVTTSATQTITGGQNIGPQTGLMTEVGSRGSWSSTFGRYAAGNISGFDFFLTGTAVEFTIFPNITGSTPMWIWVNGAPVTTAPDAITTTASTNISVKLTFPSSARRRIEFFCPHGGSWYGTNIDNATLITPAPRKPVVAFVGDSFWAGSTPTNVLQSGAFLLSRALGVECYNQSLGGTGYVNAGSFTTFGSTTRVSGVAAANPELIIFQGSLNDDGSAGIQTAAAAAYAAYATALPNARCIVFGAQPSNATSTISANRAANIAAVAAAAAAAPNVLAYHDMVGTLAGVPATWSSATTYADGSLVAYKGSVWKLINGGGTSLNHTPGANARWALQTYSYTGTGQVGTTTGDGTRDTYLYSDGVHPMPEGNAALTVREAAVIRADLLTAAA